MTRNLKALGLALAAVFALSALAATAASAAGERFHSEVEPTIITGSNVGNHVFETTEGSVTKVECTGATFSGTSKLKTESTQTVHPTYTGCTFLGETATVDTTGCNYIFGSETVEGKLPAEIECTTGYSIKVTTAACNLIFGAQKNTGGLTVTNEGSGTTRDVKTVSSTGAVFTKSGPLCGLVSGTHGLYTGTTTTKGFKDEGVTGPIDETEGAAPGKDVTAVYKEGAQVGIWWE